MRVRQIGIYPTFKSVTEEHRKPPTELNQQSFQKPVNKINLLSVTGWAGVGATFVSILSGIKHFNKLHKVSAFIAAASVAGHVGLIKSHHHRHCRNI